MNSRKSTEMSTDAIQYIDTPSSAAALNTIEKTIKYILIDRLIASGQKKIKFQRRTGRRPNQCRFSRTRWLSMMTLSLFNRPQHELLSNNMLIYRSVYVLTIFFYFERVRCCDDAGRIFTYSGIYQPTSDIHTQRENVDIFFLSNSISVPFHRSASIFTTSIKPPGSRQPVITRTLSVTIPLGIYIFLLLLLLLLTLCVCAITPLNGVRFLSFFPSIAYVSYCCGNIKSI